MKNTATTQAGDQQKPRPVPPPHASQLDATGQHIGLCLAVITHLAPYIIPPTPEDNTLKNMDGGAKVATETTLMIACDRLDRLLKDDDRWHVHGFNDHLDRVKKLAEAAIANTEAHAAVLRETARPCVIHNPTVFFEDNSRKWVVMLPGINGSTPLFGTGESPEEAMGAFDRAFHARVPAAPKNEESPAVKLEAPTQPAPRRKRKNNV